MGLGGTGAYILDLVAKTPVSEIHLLDADVVEWHNLMRAPGAPTSDEIELVRSGELLKVEYYSSKYAALRDGIFPHPVRVDSETGFSEFVAEHFISFVFICIDQTTEGNSARQGHRISSCIRVGCTIHRFWREHNLGPRPNHGFYYY